MNPIFLTFNQQKALSVAGICLANLSIDTLPRYFTKGDVTSIIALTTALLQPGKLLAGLGFDLNQFNRQLPDLVKRDCEYNDDDVLHFSSSNLNFFCVDKSNVIVYEQEPTIVDIFKDIALNKDVIEPVSTPNTTQPLVNNNNSMFDIYLINVRALVTAMNKKLSYQELIGTTQFQLSIGL
jgi:hypothetical protein